MKIQLDPVREEPFSWHRTETVTPAALDRDNLVALGPVEWRGSVEFADPGFYLRARLAYEQTLTCDRCLAPFVQPVSSDIELLVLVEPSQQEEVGEHQLEEEELGMLVIEEEVLDTAPLLLEQLQLNIPMKPLCRSDCAGLCPRCGADLNAGPCDCRTDEVDPRWAGLAEIRSRLAEEETEGDGGETPSS
jgi:uncharacterized protein